jgi:hypothetical protein
MYELARQAIELEHEAFALAGGRRGEDYQIALAELVDKTMQEFAFVETEQSFLETLLREEYVRPENRGDKWEKRVAEKKNLDPEKAKSDLEREDRDPNFGDNWNRVAAAVREHRTEVGAKSLSLDYGREVERAMESRELEIQIR